MIPHWVRFYEAPCLGKWACPSIVTEEYDLVWLRTTIRHGPREGWPTEEQKTWTEYEFHLEWKAMEAQGDDRTVTRKWLDEVHEYQERLNALG